MQETLYRYVACQEEVSEGPLPEPHRDRLQTKRNEKNQSLSRPRKHGNRKKERNGSRQWSTDPLDPTNKSGLQTKRKENVSHTCELSMRELEAPGSSPLALLSFLSLMRAQAASRDNDLEGESFEEKGGHKTKHKHRMTDISDGFHYYCRLRAHLILIKNCILR